MKGRDLMLGALGASALLVAGCRSTAFEGRKGLVENQLNMAEEAGASKYDLQQVQQSVDMARDAEKRAAKDQKAAREDLEWAREEKIAAQSRLRAAERDQTRIDGELTRSQEELQDLRGQREELIAKGVTDEQADAVVSPRIGSLESMISQLEAAREVVQKRVDLATLDRDTAQEYEVAANSRMQGSEDRMQLAVALYELAEKQGRSLEAEALRIERGDLYDRLSTDAPPSEPTSVPTSTEGPAGAGSIDATEPAGTQGPMK